MKPVTLTRAPSLGRLSVVAVVLSAFTLCLWSQATTIDANLQVTASRVNQNIVLSWFASNSVSYQVEASPTSTTWTNFSPVLAGGGGFLFVTNPMANPGNLFFRVKRLLPQQVITATFDPSTGVLTIMGDGLDNIIVVKRNSLGVILINNGAVSIAGGVPTIANTSLIQIFGQNGNDQLALDEASGAMPSAHIYGSTGNDTLTGGSGADLLSGGPGNDTLYGKGGADNLFGGDDNDTLSGGDYDDLVFGEDGDDTMVWGPGDDNDLLEGGSGNDTVQVNGGGGAEDFTIVPNNTRVRFDRINPAPFFLDIGTSEKLVLNANGGNDTLNCTGNLAALIQIHADGGAGDDTLLGSNGNDTLIGGDANDFIDGQQGNDTVFMGAGNDTFQWDPGDGNDTVEGQGGSDRMIFNGTAGSEIFEVSTTNSTRVRFTRNLGNIVMDLNDVEAVETRPLGGTDSFIVNDLTGTGVTSVDVNLAGTIGGVTGDGAADVVIVNGTSADDVINVLGAGSSCSVVGLAAQVNILNSEGANDSLFVNALDGADGVTATTLPAGVVKLTIDGGANNDTLLGSQGDDVFLGGDGGDYIYGDNGADVAFMGDGNDVFQWDAGDGNDKLEGQNGSDTLLFFGANIAENIDVVPNGNRVLFIRNVGSVTMDLDDVETIDFRALGGADNIVAADLSGTDLTLLSLNLRGPSEGGDGAIDSITVNGRQTNDILFVTGAPGGFVVTGLAPTVNVTNSEAANDTLTVNALGGMDVVDASALASNVVKLTINGGLGNDTLHGSPGNDLFNGGDGNDTVWAGSGNDTFVWNPGDDNDTFEGQAGDDALQFNGANVTENISLTATNGRLRFTRDVAGVITDCNDVETVNFAAAGGADNIVINDLSSTDVTAVNLNLAGAVGGVTGDAQADNIYVNGTATNDVVLVTGDASGVSVSGLSAVINLTSSEAANDRLTIYTFSGDDIMDASGLAAGGIALTANGGDDDDTLIGSAGIDILFGENGDDVLIGGPGVDTLNGGAGNNTVIQ
ncbi:MAG TPA: calcium-binding protein [Verrucomicrobiae bacterium]|nr:calcium-binding protein [Verrucomicrobiae bacterium]